MQCFRMRRAYMLSHSRNTLGHRVSMCAPGCPLSEELSMTREKKKKKRPSSITPHLSPPFPTCEPSQYLALLIPRSAPLLAPLLLLLLALLLS